MEERDGVPRLLLITLGVLVVTLLASFGFQTLSQNPLEPTAEIEIRDAPAALTENATGVTPMVEIEHVRGEPMPVVGLEVVVGPRVQGVVFNQDNGWAPDLTGVEIRLWLDGKALRVGQEFSPGDTIVMVRTGGAFSTVEPAPARIRLVHTPTDSVIAEATVTVR